MYELVNNDQERWLYELVNHDQERWLYELVKYDRERWLYELVNHVHEKWLYEFVNHDQERWLYELVKYDGMLAKSMLITTIMLMIMPLMMINDDDDDNLPYLSLMSRGQTAPSRSGTTRKIKSIVASNILECKWWGLQGIRLLRLHHDIRMSQCYKRVAS